MNQKEKKPRRSKAAMAAELVPPQLVPVGMTVEIPEPADPPPPRPKKGQAAPSCSPVVINPPAADVAELRAHGVEVVFTPDVRPGPADFAAAAAALITVEKPREVTPEETAAFRAKVLNALEVQLASKLLQRDYALFRLRREQKLYDSYRVDAEDIQRRIERLKARMRQGQ